MQHSVSHKPSVDVTSQQWGFHLLYLDILKASPTFKSLHSEAWLIFFSITLVPWLLSWSQRGFSISHSPSQPAAVHRFSRMTQNQGMTAQHFPAIEQSLPGSRRSLGQDWRFCTREREAMAAFWGKTDPLCGTSCCFPLSQPQLVSA